MTRDEYERLRDFFYRRTGIHFDDAKRLFVERRVRERIAVTSAGDFRTWFLGLRGDLAGTELQELVNALTVNETYFLREAYQLDCLVRDLLDTVLRDPRRPPSPLRIWSIPCSTGEEPYSIAITLLERWPGLADHDVEILASDIDSRVLEAARAARYRERSLQHVPAALRDRYFREVEPGCWEVVPMLREAVAFSRVNLHDGDAVRRLQPFDVVFCRNLLIYFDDVSRRQAGDTLWDVVRPGGFVCLGHSESMSRISSLFDVRKFADAIVYQKPGRSAGREP